ncbi:hypothetical protein KY317_03240 [Candidatus Woesearchaeota archaeon]|nr:hypothetical protein [Candidatus Woesearchaeota archaeon]
MVAGTLIVMQIITTVIMIIVGALLLMVSAKIFKLKDQSFKTALKVVLIIYVINFVLGLIGIISLGTALIMSVLSFLVLIILGIYLIKKYYNLDLGKAVLVWIVWFILSLIAGFIIGIILGLILGGAMLAALA